MSIAVLSIISFIIWRANLAARSIRKLRTAATEFQLQAIQAQINPHFIGNSINAIQQFFFPPDQFRATEYISAFTRMLRTTIDYSEQHFVPLVNEIAYNEDYLRLVQLRFGNRFHYNINISPEINIQTMHFPTMLLQPILENSTIHGLAPEGPSLLDISIKQKNGLLICAVSDNGIGINKNKALKADQPKSHQSKGLMLLHKKINTMNELYNFDCTLSITDLSDISIDKQGTQTILSFNQHKAQKQTKSYPS
jgi:LytS/YehU family sensor histidine kinase